VPAEPPAKVAWPITVARHDLYGDAINEGLVIAPGRALTSTLLVADTYVVDGALTGGPAAVGAYGGVLRGLQNGYVRSYALSVLAGGIILVLALLAVNWS